MHEAGRLNEAESLYQEVLALDEAHASALHLLGVLCHQRGDDVRAIESIGRALAIRPNMAQAHANMADVYRTLGQMERLSGAAGWPQAIARVLGSAL